jgi:hypothetical protein
MKEHHLLIRLQSNGHMQEHLMTENILVLSVLLCAFILLLLSTASQQADRNCHGAVENKTIKL